MKFFKGLLIFLGLFNLFITICNVLNGHPYTMLEVIFDTIITMNMIYAIINLIVEGIADKISEE